MKIGRPEDIGALLRDYRMKRGLSQADLATRLQTTQKWVSHIENGKPTAQVGLVLRALNELGFTLIAALDDESVRHRPSKARPSAIDDIVDG
jgi:HTH-type transcriptional regulator / antitoxin HipB